jgi:hypothetical protein
MHHLGGSGIVNIVNVDARMGTILQDEFLVIS